MEVQLMFTRMNAVDVYTRLNKCDLALSSQIYEEQKFISEDYNKIKVCQ